MKFYSLFWLFWALSTQLYAQSCGFAEGKNLAQLQAAIAVGKTSFAKNEDLFVRKSTLGQWHAQKPQQKKPAPIMLPAWSAASLPFFCKIEHDWGKKSRLPFKFRLGSVEYVDWLEGK